MNEATIAKRTKNEATIAVKQSEVNAVVELMKNAGSLLFVDYLGLTVAEVSELRNKLHAENCQMKVIKNNILRRAAQEAGYDVPAENFFGPSAAIFSADEVTGARITFGFAKTHEKITVKGGVVDSKPMDAANLKVLSALPNKDGMISMLLSVMQAPIRSLACAIKAVSEKE